MKQNIAIALSCGSAAIPPEYEKAACSLAARYVTSFSLSGLYRMDYEIVYNRTCNRMKRFRLFFAFSAGNYVLSNGTGPHT